MDRWNNAESCFENQRNNESIIKYDVREAEQIVFPIWIRRLRDPEEHREKQIPM